MWPFFLRNVGQAGVVAAEGLVGKGLPRQCDDARSSGRHRGDFLYFVRRRVLLFSEDYFSNVQVYLHCDETAGLNNILALWCKKAKIICMC